MTTVQLPAAPAWSTATYEDSGDICHDRDFPALANGVHVSLHRRGDDDTEILAEVLVQGFTPAEARKLAAVLVEAADLADQG